MAENVIIRELSQNLNEVLDKYKKENNISVNTKAACGMMKEYYPLRERLAKVTAEKHEISTKYGKLLYWLDRKIEAENQINQIINS